MKKLGIIGGLIWLIVAVALLVGEVKCIIKMVQCNWEPIGKAEVIYTAATFTGVGCIVGYIDIQDK
jgi:hypothetical protein